MSKLSKVFAFLHSPVVLTAAAIHTIPAPWEGIVEMLAASLFAHFGITFGEKKKQEA